MKTSLLSRVPRLEPLELRMCMACGIFESYGQSPLFPRDTTDADTSDDCVTAALAAGDVLNALLDVTTGSVDPAASTFLELLGSTGTRVIGSRMPFAGDRAMQLPSESPVLEDGKAGFVYHTAQEGQFTLRPAPGAVSGAFTMMLNRLRPAIESAERVNEFETPAIGN